MIACVIAGGCIYLLIDKTNFLTEVLGKEFLTIATWMLIGAGGVMMFMTFTGCCGASKENESLLIVVNNNTVYTYRAGNLNNNKKFVEV